MINQLVISVRVGKFVISKMNIEKNIIILYCPKSNKFKINFY